MRSKIATLCFSISLTLIACNEGDKKSEKDKPQETANHTPTNKDDKKNPQKKPTDKTDAGQGAPPVSGLRLASSADVECNSKRKGFALYDIDASTFVFCDESEWQPIDLTGPPGPKGGPGAKGQKGDPGDTGPQGSTGSQGIAGPSGLQGLTGNDGSPGPTGPTGSQGPIGYSSLISTQVEAAGANCANGGTKVLAGIDNGDGSGSAGDNTLHADEIDNTAYVCDGPINFLKIYDSSDNALFYYVSNQTIIDGTDQIAIIVKSLSENKYGLYRIGKSNTSTIWWTENPEQIGFACNPSANKCYVHFESSDCTGQGYMQRYFENSSNTSGQKLDVMLNFPNLYLAYGSQYEIKLDAVYDSQPSKDFNSYLGTDNSCYVTSASFGDYYEMTIENSLFPNNFGVGWYIAP